MLALQLTKVRIGQGDQRIRAITKVYNDAKDDTKLTGLTLANDVRERCEEIRLEFSTALEDLTGTLAGEAAETDLNEQVKKILGLE